MVSINIPRESTVTSDPSWPKPPHIIRNCCLHKIGLNQMVSNIACIRVRDGKLQKYFCTSSWFFCKMSWVWCWGREVYDCNVTQDFIETKWCFTKQQWVFAYDMESKTCSESSLRKGGICLPRCSNHCDIAQTVFLMSRQTAQHQVASRVTHTDNPQTNHKDRHHYYISRYIPQNYNKALENRWSQKDSSL